MINFLLLLTEEEDKRPMFFDQRRHWLSATVWLEIEILVDDQFSY